MKRFHNNTPSGILTALTDELSKLTCVRRIVSFGSVASGVDDQWSDVDILVVCDHVDPTGWHCASLIRRATPVLFYREFSSREQPSGRYWFLDESPMNRLDISFETEEEYADIRTRSMTNGHNVVLRDEYIAVCTPSLDKDKAEAIPWKHIPISPEETEIGRCLLRALEAIKVVLRGNHNWKWNREECVSELEIMLQQFPHFEFAGGDLMALAKRCLEMNRYAEGTLEPINAGDNLGTPRQLLD